MASELTRRLTVAAIGIPLCAAVAYTGGVVFASGLGILAYIAVAEIGAMLGERGRPNLTRFGALLAGLFPLVVLLFGTPAIGWFVAVCLFSLLGFAALRIPPAEMPFQAAGLTFTAVIYVGGLLAYGVALREWYPDRLAGTVLFFLPVVVTWIADTAAYTGGRALGRRKLAPAISPNKTVEGGAAGLLVGLMATIGYVWIALPGLFRELGLWRLLALGAVLAVAAILGDLVESALKRECGVKDSSALLPGHGGLLDRMDSLLWTIPVAYLFIAALA